MDEIRFWQLIGEVRESGAAGVQTLIAKLSELPPDEILAYQKYFYDAMNASYTSTLWAAAYIIAGGCSDDSFSDFRAWLIMQGQTTFWQVVADPEVLAELVESDDIFRRKLSTPHAKHMSESLETRILANSISKNIATTSPLKLYWTGARMKISYKPCCRNYMPSLVIRGKL